MKKFWKKTEGFTLVELIVVIAILGILAGVGTVGYNGYIKKAQIAADEQLLSAVNGAFAAACAANGDDVNAVDGAYIGLNTDKTVKMDSVDPYKDSFAQFYAGNETSAFKVYPGIYFDLTLHKFMAGSEAYMKALDKILTEMGSEINLVKASAYASIGASKLMGAVDGVTTFAAELIAGNSKLTPMIMNDTYFANVAEMMGIEGGADAINAMIDSDPNGALKILANSTVLSVAETVNSDTYNRGALATKLASGKLSDVVGAVTTSDNGLAEAALIYGLYTAYAPDKAGEITGLSGLAALANDTNGFMKYLQGLSDSTSQAYKDMNGYYAALDIVNEAVSDDPEVANQVLTNGYGDGELTGIVGSVIGG